MFVDATVLGLLVLFALLGAYSGVWIQLLQIGLVLVAFFIAWLMAQPVAQLININANYVATGMDDIALILVFWVAYFILYYSTWLVIKGRNYQQGPLVGFHLNPGEVLSTHEYLSRDPKLLWINPIFGAILGTVKISLMLILTLQVATFFKDSMEPLFAHFNRSKLVRLANRVDRLGCLQPMPVQPRQIQHRNVQHRRIRNQHIRNVKTIRTSQANTTWNRLSQK